MLERSISALLDTQPIAQSQNSSEGEPTQFLKSFYDHPIIAGMFRNSSHPSYIPARTFATAVIDLATSRKQGSITFADLESGIKEMPEGNVKKALLSLLQQADGELATARTAIE